VAGNDIRPTKAGRSPIATPARASITGVTRPRALSLPARSMTERCTQMSNAAAGPPIRRACDQAASPEQQAARRTLKPPIDARHPAADRPVTDRADAGEDCFIVLPGGNAGQTRIVQWP
jgi:hypothetical protein